MNSTPSEADLLRAKIHELEGDLQREKERSALLKADRERLRQLIFPPLSDDALSELLSGVCEEELLGPETARRELEALLHDDDRK